ncbi:MAG TPA: hypothetical protein VHS52_07905 [Acidimicrobiales bacterium]|jgi:hypothetical protein|nr:hypothetical protein [Acidimicrobiales bacterium]
MSPLALLAVVAEEAPSSISGSDQLRAALVLGACLLAMGVLVLLAVRQGRRRQRATGFGRDQDPGEGLKPDQNGRATRPPGR